MRSYIRCWRVIYGDQEDSFHQYYPTKDDSERAFYRQVFEVLDEGVAWIEIDNKDRIMAALNQYEFDGEGTQFPVSEFRPRRN